MTTLSRLSLPALPHRRTVLRWLHWVMIPLAVWFTFLDPGEPLPNTAFWRLVQSNLALIFVSGALLWIGLYARHGLTGRPGPKLPPWARVVHRILHHALVWGLIGVALTGLGLGLTASRQLMAGGFVPVGVPLSMPELNAWIGWLHKWEFYALSAVIAVHAAFHVWRHVALRDNVLRIMAPRWTWRWL